MAMPCFCLRRAGEMEYAIIYLHGFNSASLDLSGNLLVSKQKLAVLKEFCEDRKIKLYTPNVDYSDFKKIVNDLLLSFKDFEAEAYKVIFMGSSLGGFTSEYMAMKTKTKAIMINPAMFPATLLTQFIGTTENFETHQPYNWKIQHCEQYQQYEHELRSSKENIDCTILLDMGDELLDSHLTLKQFNSSAKIITYPGGSHSFEHIEQALPTIEKVIYSLK